MDNNYFGAAMPPSGTCAHDKARSFAIYEGPPHLSKGTIDHKQNC